MVISQVIHKNHCLRLPFTSVPPPFVLMPILYLRCGALDRLRPGAGAASTSSTPSLNDVFAKLLSDTDVCEFDAVIMVDHPGVSSTTLPPLHSIFPCHSKTLISLSCLIQSYTRPTCAHSPHPHLWQCASKTLPRPCNSPTCASLRRAL